MKAKNVTSISVNLTAEHLEALDEWRENVSKTVGIKPPSRHATILVALDFWADAQSKKMVSPD